MDDEIWIITETKEVMKMFFSLVYSNVVYCYEATFLKLCYSWC